MSTVDNTGFDGAVKTGPQIADEIAVQFGNTDTELDARPESAVAETIIGAWNFSTKIGIGKAPSTMLDIEAIDAQASAQMTSITETANQSPQSIFRRSGSSGGTPTATVNAVNLGAFSFRGHTGAGWSGSKAFIVAQTTENWGVAANGTKISFQTTLNGTTTVLERMVIENNGDVRFKKNIIVDLLVDGRDVAADGTKLDTIDTSAKANLSDLLDVNTAGRLDTYILEWDTTTSKYVHVAKPAGGSGSTNLSTSYFTGSVRVNSDTGTDATINEASGAAAGMMSTTHHDKLDAIEAAADVTDATNVEAAGAIMDSDISADGLMVRTASGAYTSREIAIGTDGGFTITNANGDAGNPTLEADYTISTAAPTGTPARGHVWYRY